MKEVTNPQLFELQMRIQGMPITNDPDIQWKLYKAWEVTMIEDITVYRVEIVNQIQVVLKGLLLWPMGELYLDQRSIMILVNERIQANLDAFNAGYHWRYKGL